MSEPAATGRGGAGTSSPAPRFTLREPIYPVVGAIVLVITAFGVAFPEAAAAQLNDVRRLVLETFGWFYLLVVGVLVIAVLLLAFSRCGDLKLGPDDGEPEYGYLPWFTMLVAASLGIGLLYYGATEPLVFYSAPITGDPGSLDAAREAMSLTLFHWGFHGWAIYAAVGLTLAYFSFRHDLPLRVSSGLYPLIGRRIYGPVGRTVDIVAIAGILFGVATVLGLGAVQVNVGLNRLWGLPQTTSVQAALSVALTGVAVVVMAMRLDDVIRRLSQGVLVLVLLLLFFVLAAGPTQFLLHAFVQNFGSYLDHLAERTFGAYAYDPGNRLEDWTLYYWAGWIAWAPFGGVFIAQISRGRTVREFILGVLLVPTVFSCFWLTVFGNSAISFDMGEAAGALSAEARQNYAGGLFLLLEQLPLSTFSGATTCLLVAAIFVTTSHSGAMVVDTIVVGGTAASAAGRRTWWCVLQGAVVASLLPTGGFAILYGVTGVSALVFSVVLLLLIVGLIMGMRTELGAARGGASDRMAPAHALGWQAQLGKLLLQEQREDVDAFIETIALPVLDDVAHELRRRGMEAWTERSDDGGVALEAKTDAARRFSYRIVPTSQPAMVLTPSEATKPRDRRSVVWKARVALGDSLPGHNVSGFGRDELIADILKTFEREQGAP